MMKFRKGDKCYLVGKGKEIFVIGHIDNGAKKASVQSANGGEWESAGLEKLRTRPLVITFK